MPEGLELGAVCARAASGETLVALPEAVDVDADFVELRHGARVGTSSPRRQRWLAAKRPDLVLDELRGNVPTRVQKLRDGERYDAILLASAGLDRLELDLEGLHAQRLGAEVFPCCPGQGALGLQIRSNDDATRALIATLDDATTRCATRIERGVLAALGGGCSLPLGAYCEAHEAGARVRAFAFGPAVGLPPIVLDMQHSDEEQLVARVAERLQPALSGALSGQKIGILASVDEPRLANEARAAGAEVTHVAAYESVELEVDEAAMRDAIAHADAILFASARCATRLARILGDLGDGAFASDCVLLAPGEASAERLREHFGAMPVRVGNPPRGEGMAHGALECGAKRVVLLGAEGGNDDAATILAEAGVELSRFALHSNRPLEDADASALHDCDAVLVAAPAAIETAQRCQARRWIAIGASTARAFKGRDGPDMLVAERPEVSALIALLQRAE